MIFCDTSTLAKYYIPEKESLKERAIAIPPLIIFLFKFATHHSKINYVFVTLETTKNTRFSENPPCHLYFSLFLGVKKRHFFVCFLPKIQTKTTICCGQTLLFIA